MPKVLILDANQRSALAATRSLGVKGLEVVAADETTRTLAGSSKYCKETFEYPSPYEYQEEFLRTVRDESNRRDIQVIFPMTEISTYLVLKHRDELKGIAIPFPPIESFDLLRDKSRLFELAHKLSVPVPGTHVVKTGTEISKITSRLKFPVVIKPYCSRILLDGRWMATSVQYARSVSELESTFKRIEYLNRCPFLIQEYIQGEGRGIFALYDQGKPILFFAHRRLREKPPSGGVSVLSESIQVDPPLREIAQKILDHVKWHGVAMVEFKVTAEGTPYLIEVNPRFWGSLQLAIDAGVDFPFLLYQLAMGERLEAVNSYKTGIKSRWLLGDLDHLYLTFKSHSGQGLKIVSKWRAMTQFLNFFERDIRFEVNRWNDLRPFLFELKQYMGVRGRGSGVRG